jgi:aspartyl-tRNA(Asn)/glutamyl-tRNA(Gln) amidotransferase subunit C
VSFVRRLAAQVRIELTDEEAEAISRDLSKILKYVNELGKLDLGGVEPTYWLTPATSSLRADAPGSCLERSVVLGNAVAEAGYVKAPRV